ncbi:BREX-3 system P-loop-containing protein BrxF [Peribacillus asahii]|uniref:BREX-3 system P-loop-containing protein BrxF n=1 Tax=Peribacillus asahii TaxID=228899 RepID=A0A398BJ38_9BACI|nr:BREX-3 system P-loop-containing protein BrxF [Peribacillus asahii]RID89031.1 BREX-3 system P-loop-containing protein BrxF [Peribacillus asahii]
MRTDLVRKIEQELKSISSKYYKILLVCEHQKGNSVQYIGQSGNFPVLNISLLLSEKLKEYPRKRMTNRVHALLSDILKETSSDVICLEHIEILFDPNLNQDAIQLLQSFSRNYTLIVSWRGTYNGKKFTYAVPGHPEYYECSDFDGTIIT